MNALASRIKVGSALLLVVLGGAGLMYSFNSLPGIHLNQENRNGTSARLYLGTTQGGRATIAWSVTSNLRGQLDGSSAGGELYDVPFDRTFALTRGETLTIHFEGGFNVIGSRTQAITCSVHTNKGVLVQDHAAKKGHRPEEHPRDVNCSTWVVHP